MKDRKNILLNLDWFDAHFWSFFSKDNQLIKKFNQKLYKVSTSVLSSRVLTHWQSHGVLTDDRTKNKGWRVFSFSEQVWIKCIIELRGFGMNLEKIKKVKEQLELYQNSDIESQFPELDFYLAYGLSTGHPIKLIVFKDGEAIIAKQYSIDIAKQYSFITGNYISIDLNELVNGLLKNKQYEIDYIDYAKSEIEKEVSNSIYLENVDSISIKLNNGEDYIVNKEKIMYSKKEMEMLLNKLQYAEASISKKKNHKVYKVKEKKRIKK